MKKISKWKWLEQKCHEVGIPEAEEIAKEIEDKLKEEYGNTITDDFLKNLKKIEKNFKEDNRREILYVSIIKEYCIACKEANSDCNYCNFREPCEKLVKKFRDAVRSFFTK